MDITYKKITTGVRPPRIAVFFNRDSKGWRSIIEGIIEIFSTIWGGRYNIIVPTDGNIIEEHFLQILREFNPDICCYYNHTNVDFLYSSEGIKEKENLVKVLMERFSISRIEAEMQIYANKTPDELDIFDKNEQFVNYLTSKLSFFYNKDKPKLIRWHWQTKRPMNALKIEHYFSEVQEHVGPPFYYDLDNCSEDFKLLLASYTGSGKYLYSKRLDIHIEQVTKETELYLIRDIYERRVPDTYPFALSGYGLSETSEFYSIGTEILSCVLIFGSSASDYSLFYGLSKIMNCIYWIPSIECFKEQYTGLGYITLSRIIEENSILGINSLKISSCSLLADELRLLEKEIWGLPISECSEESLKIEIVAPNDIGIKREFHVYEQGNAYNNYIQQFDNGISTNFITSPYPRHFKSIPAYKAGWVIDYQIEGIGKNASTTGYILPNDYILVSNLFNNSVFPELRPEFLRTNADKYSVLCPYTIVTNTQMTLADVTPRPIFRLQNGIEIFNHIFSRNGYSIESSDKGKYMKYSIGLFGSINAIAEILKNDEVCNALKCFSDHTEPGLRKHKGIYGIKLKSGVYLNYNDFRSFFKDEKFARECMNNFIHRNILSRGFIFKCEQCDNSGWYNISSVTETFVCSRCDHKQIYLPTHWRENDEPTFYYRLNEMFYQGFSNNMKEPLLGLVHLQSSSLRSFFYEAELNVLDLSLEGKKKMELDMVCLVDGKLWIGEGKSGGLSKKDVGKYLDLCNRLDATFFLVTRNEISEEIYNYLQSLPWNTPPFLYRHISST